MPAKMDDGQEWSWVSDVRYKVMEVLKDRAYDCIAVLDHLSEIPVKPGSQWYNLKAMLTNDALFKMLVEKLVEKCKESEKEKYHASKECAGDCGVGKVSGKTNKETADEVKQVAKCHNGNGGIMAFLAENGSNVFCAVVNIIPHALKVMNGEISKGQFAAYALRDGAAAFMNPGAQPVFMEISLTQNNLYLLHGHPYRRV